MNKRKKEHRRNKLFEKMQSEVGMRMQNKWWRGQLKLSKLPVIVINELLESDNEMVEAWLDWAKTPGTLIYKPAQSPITKLKLL